MVCRLSIAVPSLALVCLVALASLPAPALAGKAPWCSPPGGPWRQLPAQGNISQTLADAIVTDFLDNQQANSSFSPCVKDELKTTILGCVRVTDNTTGNGIPSTDFKLWITLSCPVGKSEVSVGLLVEATEPREDVIETGDAQPVVLGVDVLFVRLDGKKVQGRDPKGKEYFPDVTMAAPKPKPRPRAPVPEAAPAPAATPAPEATPAPSPAPAAPSPALAA